MQWGLKAHQVSVTKAALLGLCFLQGFVLAIFPDVITPAYQWGGGTIIAPLFIRNTLREETGCPGHRQRVMQSLSDCYHCDVLYPT